MTHQEDIETYDVNAKTPAALLVENITQQDAWESRKAWAGVIDALNRGDMQGTSDEKSKIEQAQRQMRKKEVSEKIKWHQAFFSPAQTDPIFEELAAPIGQQLHADKTVGVWKFDPQKAKSAKKPYHGDLKPWDGG